ncbi:hypothetical protein FOZ63_028884 [Perkinsus olseni]|uniref:Uncharacterized protein n=1 Tax=Perkinsus olseni TaxID=32597 RepID=A0A7J6UIA9_PEROL|nr:hypothetical protein FOZ62_030183 [Perkinsus olseni]KAF4756768.1 hypothetical protein FOZ63_028884 [Perkinsus olseni]
MYTIVGILCFMCLGGIALDSEVEDSARKYLLRSPLLNASSGGENLTIETEGGPYEKPIGECVIKGGYVVGCHCNNGDLWAIAVSLKGVLVVPDDRFHPDVIDLVLCSKKCGAGIACPRPTGPGAAQCNYNYCMTHCRDDTDCLKGGRCEYIFTGGFCVFFN